MLVTIVLMLGFIGVGLHFTHPRNYHPFSPRLERHARRRIHHLFTCIGFDSGSIASGECKGPQRTVPIGILATLIVRTLLYIGVALVLTGIVPWKSIIGDSGVPVVRHEPRPLLISSLKTGRCKSRSKRVSPHSVNAA